MTALHLHHLTGCASTPLARYLKALGILRIVGEKKDREARSWWQDEHFCLLTRHLLTGGAAPDGDWNVFAEECAVLSTEVS